MVFKWQNSAGLRRLVASAASVLLGVCVFAASAEGGAGRSAQTAPSRPAARPQDTRPAAQSATRPGQELRTDHYNLYVENLDANETGRMLEQLHAQLTRFFGRSPKDRLPVAIYATRDRWAAALKADRQYVPQAGGYYAPDNKKAYAWHQPSAYFTRQLLIHEATHQFHYLAATGNRTPSGGWYTEGMAEYFGMHNWDGRRLETGVIPAITLEDYPARALKHFQDANCDLEGMVAGRVAKDRSEAWALIHFLVNRHPKEFRDLAARLDAHEDAAGSWKAVFGSSTPKLAEELHGWIKDHTQPWQIVWISWQQRGEAIEGDARTNGLAVLKQTPGVLEAELEPVSGPVKAGLVFGFASAEDFHLFQVMGKDKYRIIRRKPGKWVPIATGDLPLADGRNVLSVQTKGDSTVLKANGKEVSTLKVAGQVGLNVDACKVLFRVGGKEQASATGR